MKYQTKQSSSTGLLILIGILAVVLVAAGIIALSIFQTETPPAESTGATSVPPPEDTTPSEGTTPSENTTPSEPAAIADLNITEPTQFSFLSFEKQVEFCGTADPREKLTINGETVTVESDGTFRHSVQLKTGSNEISVTYQGQTVSYQIEHRYALQSITPDAKETYSCGATVQVSAAIRDGATLTVTFNGESIPMKKAEDQHSSDLAEGFVLYTGSYQLPQRNTEDLDLGVITFTASCDGVTETMRSGKITCLKRTDVLASDPSVTPDDDSYVNVGSGYIVEILTPSAETFLGSNVSTDKSDPRVNYLPEGTVDYGYVKDIENGTLTIRLRCGRRVYRIGQTSNIQISRAYKGTLPDHNEIGFASLDQSYDYTIVTLDTLWKAPFYFELLPQKYVAPGIQDFRITKVTAEYVDITFCYATKFTGSVTIPSDNPLFSRAAVTQNESDCTLRLYLKEVGGFYGWDAYYNESDQLCFRFINPKTVRKTQDNPYGVDLTGIQILLDVGHGGKDCGTWPDGSPVSEAAMNLELAWKIKAELESMGATVIMNRTTDYSLSRPDRIRHLKELAPDLCLAIHQNSMDNNPGYNGVEIGYATPFSQPAAQLIYEETVAAGIYRNHELYWHFYYVARETACPVVLLENGYMSNSKDLAGIMDEDVQLEKAQAIARGVARYFLAINQ